MTTKNDIRFTLIQLMEDNHVKVKELASYLGVTQQSVSAWRTGKSSIDIERLIPICEFFNISINQFFGIVNKNADSPSLTIEERQLIGYFRNVSKPCQKAILASAKAMTESEKTIRVLLQ